MATTFYSVAICSLITDRKTEKNRTLKNYCTFTFFKKYPNFTFICLFFESVGDDKLQCFAKKKCDKVVPFSSEGYVSYNDTKLIS